MAFEFALNITIFMCPLKIYSSRVVDATILYRIDMDILKLDHKLTNRNRSVGNLFTGYEHTK